MTTDNWRCRRCGQWFRTILQLDYHDKYHCQVKEAANE